MSNPWAQAFLAEGCHGESEGGEGDPDRERGLSDETDTARLIGLAAGSRIALAGDKHHRGMAVGGSFVNLLAGGDASMPGRKTPPAAAIVLLGLWTILDIGPQMGWKLTNPSPASCDAQRV
jgi:hypothetical protein